MSRPASQKKASWVFGILSLAFLGLSYALTRGDSTLHPIVRLIGATFAGLFGYFFTGSTNIVVERDLPRIGRTSLQAGGGAALFIVVFLFWPSTSDITVQILLHGGQKSDLVPLNGEVSIALENRLLTSKVEAPGRALFQGIPRSWKGKTASCSLASRDYKLMSPATIVVDDEVPAYLRVMRRYAFARPDESNVRLEFVTASAIRDGPHPEVIWLNIQLRGVALTDKPVPIGSKATFSVRSSRGTELQRADLELSTGLTTRGVVLNPNEVTSIFLDDGVPREMFALHGTSHMWEVTFRYDSLVEASEVSFHLGPFDFDSTSIPFER